MWCDAISTTVSCVLQASSEPEVWLGSLAQWAGHLFHGLHRGLRPSALQHSSRRGRSGICGRRGRRLLAHGRAAHCPSRPARVHPCKAHAALVHTMDVNQEGRYCGCVFEE